MTWQRELIETGITRPRLKTPRAAATAGIIFAIIYGLSLLLIRTAVPEELTGGIDWLPRYLNSVRLSVTLLPFAGIAFLWFVAVVRSRLGEWEDQFFSTVFFGSGILIIAMFFVSGALSGGLLSVYSLQPKLLEDGSIYAVTRATIYHILNIYGVRMEGVFMMSLGTIWLRTGIMPRWLVILTYSLALMLLLIVAYSTWITLVFPAWVLIISIVILMGHPRAADDAKSTGNAGESQGL